MSRRNWHRVHKWITIVVGVFFLMWMVTGIIMMIPQRFYAPIPLTSSNISDYRSANVSPAQAIASIEETIGTEVDVGSMWTTSILGSFVYVISTTDAPAYLVSAENGEVITITSDLAELISRRFTGTQAKVREIENIPEHNLVYLFGPLPVYRVVFEDDRSTIYYVSKYDGSVSRSTRLTPIVAALTSLHTFEPVKLISQRDATRKGLLILVSLGGIAAALTGYFIAILPYIRRRNKQGKPNRI